MSLLNDALNANVNKGRKRPEFTGDDYELTSAWLDDKITISQVAVAKNFSSSVQSYSYLAQVCRDMFGRNGNAKKETKGRGK